MRTTRSMLALSLFVALSVHAQSTPTNLDLAKQLVKLLQLDGMLDDDLKECAQPQNSPLDAATAYKKYPESFEGLSPDSQYWPEVEAIYDRFQERACHYVTSEELTKHFAEEFSERSTEDDIRASISFYSSPAGKRLQTATRDVNRELQSYLSTLMRKAHKDAEERYQKEIREVLTKYHAAKK